MSSNWIPDSIVMKPMSRSSGGYAYYMNDSEAVRGFVRCNENSVFNEFARIDIERAVLDRRYIHLRFRHSNKYWSRRGPGTTDHWIVAVSNKPVEDTTDPACTMFEPTVSGEGRFMLRHVQSRGYVTIDTTQTGDLSDRLFVFAGSLAESPLDRILFDFVNWQTLFKLPQRIALRGSNGRWLRSATVLSQPHVQFLSTDPNERESAFEIELNDDGHIRIKSAHLNRYLRRNNVNNNWLLADAVETNRNDDTLFWPVLVTGSNYAIRSKGNNRFLRLLSAESRTDCLSASSLTMSSPATFLLQELILERHVYHTRFRMDQVQISDERTVIAGTGTSVNNSDTPSTLSITISYEEKSSFSFLNGSSSSTSATISTAIPKLGMEIGFSNSKTISFEWGEVIEETKLSEASLEVMVPPRSGVRVDYVGTQGTCSIPFNYTQRDKSSSDGQYITSSNIDGIFKGVNYHSFHFEQHAVERLDIKPDAVAPAT